MSNIHGIRGKKIDVIERAKKISKMKKNKFSTFIDDAYELT